LRVNKRVESCAHCNCRISHKSWYRSNRIIFRLTKCLSTFFGCFIGKWESCKEKSNQRVGQVGSLMNVGTANARSIFSNNR
jgi:hypothetical protein